MTTGESKSFIERRRFMDKRRMQLCIAFFVGTMLPLSIGSLAQLGGMWFDETHPIATARWEVVGRNESSVMVSLRGERFRPECSYIRLKVYAFNEGKPIVDLPRQRIDQPEMGRSLAPGKRSFGDWLILLNDPDIEKFQIVSEYRCNWRNVSVILAEVPL